MYTGKNRQQQLIYKNNLLLFFSKYNKMSKIIKFKRVLGTATIYSQREIWNLSEPFLLRSDSTRLVLGQLKKSNHISFYKFCNFKAFTRHPFFFLLCANPLLTSASLFLQISSPFPSLFLHTSLNHIEVFNHYSFLILASLVPLNVGPSGTKTVLRAASHLVTLLSAPRSLLRFENIWLYNFPDPNQIIVVTLRAGHLGNSRGILVVFCLSSYTGVHPV